MEIHSSIVRKTSSLMLLVAALNEKTYGGNVSQLGGGVGDVQTSPMIKIVDDMEGGAPVKVHDKSVVEVFPKGDEVDDVGKQVTVPTLARVILWFVQQGHNLILSAALGSITVPGVLC
ncbi:hypothetical protein L2E82_31745 [Cichorium intybus]|uniref:Uncharacterized protein n=1 Tax=Cichorium intybus TaxID=13427 RepID=A0ACB9BEE2_CICIN|nr:hypothetical protein L2E82_31745 [Cichorium intybus]